MPKPAVVQRISHIVPSLPPVTGGVGDYGYILAQEMRRYRIDGGFVVTDGPTNGDETLGAEGWSVQVLADRSAAALVVTLEEAAADIVLLHFVGYAYAHWGLCAWLVQGLRTWKAGSGQRRLVTMFHELYAFGPPWRASFWTFLPQRRIARALALDSSAIACGYALIAGRLRTWRPSVTVHLLPVFSNVGELSDPPPLAAREPVAVVFGGAVARRRLYESIDRWPHLLADLGIEEILDIGPPLAVPSAIAEVPVRALGTLPGPEVSRTMTAARVGLVDYPLHVVGKSGIIAAYLAHGMLCVNLSTVGRLMDDVVDGRHFTGAASLRRGAVDHPQQIALEGYQWYQHHNRACTARLFADLVLGCA